MEKAITRLAQSIFVAALLAFAGWVYTISNRVTALESKQDAVATIAQDVREMRALLIQHLAVNSDSK